MDRVVASARCAAVALLVAGVCAASGTRAAVAAKPACSRPSITSGYAASVRRVLAHGRDVWGNQLIHSRTGPTYDAAAAKLKPLLFAAGPNRRLVTDTGSYYLPFGWPSQFGADTVALHVADGSEILANRTTGSSLTLGVGVGGREHYGGCLARLTAPHLLDGYLPVLQTSYTDAQGVEYEQESFAGHIRQTRSLISFVRLTVDTTGAQSFVKLRFSLSAQGLIANDNSLVRGGSTFLVASDGAQLDGSTATYDIPPDTVTDVYVGWFVDPSPSKLFTLDETHYLAARDALVAFWTARLGAGAQYDVPEERVQDAEESLLIQNLALAWRYSVGDRYHTKLSTPEAIDAATVMGEYGFGDTDKAILDVSFWRRLGITPSWRMGEQLLGTARYFQLFHDSAYLEARTAKLGAYVKRMQREVAASKVGLLPRERYSADVYANVYGLHAQSVAWEGLRAMGDVWAETGHRWLAVQARAIATRLGAALQRAIGRSATRLPDGTTFVPVQLLDDEKPYQRLTATRLGTYWNLVMPYALASGIVPPHSRRAKGVLRYMLGHGSRVLGLVRADAYTLYGYSRVPRSGTDQVYGLNMARFLADNDRPDQLVLSLYGQLAAGMTPDTYIAGEAATIAPVRDEYYRRMFLPPNSGANSAFLETLRLMLVHESDDGGLPRGLELAFSTPRAWLEPGQSISVSDAPTSFGNVSYSLDASQGVVEATVEVPPSRSLQTLKLRLRLPAGERIRSVYLDGLRYRWYDPASGTINLSGRHGALSLDIRTG
jgi:hypothetical protein